MREEARPIKICFVCKLPITPEQRPSVQLANGEEVHCECWLEYDRNRPDDPDWPSRKVNPGSKIQ